MDTSLNDLFAELDLTFSECVEKRCTFILHRIDLAMSRKDNIRMLMLSFLAVLHLPQQQNHTKTPRVAAKPRCLSMLWMVPGKVSLFHHLPAK